MKSIRRIKLEAALEQTSIYALATGDTTVYDLESYRETKQELVKEIEAEKHGDYGGGGCKVQDS